MDSFADFWRGFNHQFAAEFGHEQQKIRNLLERKLSSNSAQTLLDTHAPEIGYLIDQPVIDMRGNGRDTSQYIEAFVASNDAVEKVVQLFLIIYQVRCNLEHGQKHPNRDRDVRLCRCAAPLVAAAICNCF